MRRVAPRLRRRRWQAASPPDHYNFTSEPVVDDPYNYEPIVYDEKIGGYRRVDREPEEATV